MPTDPSFEVRTTAESEPGAQLVFGVSHLGMAGVTAADYLVGHLDVDPLGHVEASGFPTIAPLEDGRPRHPMRLYASKPANLTVFVGESFIPVSAAEAFVDGFLDWVNESSIDELVLLYGVPYPHGQAQHKVFYAATPEYRGRNLQDGEVEPLAGGFLDGVVAELLLRALDGDAPPTGVFITPAHPPGPDLDAALLLLDVVEATCGFSVDEDELREQADRMRQYYGELASRIEELGGREQPLDARDLPEDGMYM